MSLQNAVLGLLIYQPMTGYDLKSLFDKSVSFIWSAHISQIYRELGSLEGKGFVTFYIEPQQGKPDKKKYIVTENGKEHFQDWMKKFPATLSTTFRDEFAVRIFFGSNLSNEELIFQLQRYIKEKKEEIDSYGTIKELSEIYAKESNVTQEIMYWNMILKRGYMVNQVFIQWAEESILELKDLIK
ncbi:PadR family transcriptional regulator [Clostridium sp. FP2]|uniref:PadR family transcriptional regulator n=1 Tax=Clostridium sp. FP2 TaxID=2724481 RepID=UPI0013E977F4|nr:PadR family transcriptional regulator [Clostridium sp. FP2]MBZ9625573.1 PadR family transcriptional regulator [Clostridium sp. FP2]